MRTVALGEIAELRAGVGFPPRLQGRSTGDYPMAKVGDISRAGRSGEGVLNTAANFVTTSDLATLKMEPVPAGSVLFAKIGEAIRQNHRVLAGRPLLVDNNAMAAIPRTAIVEPSYFFRFMQAVDFYALTSSTTVPSLRKSELERVQVPLPPLPEQRRIAAILDHADALRAKRRQALAHLDALTQSIFYDMFGDEPSGATVEHVATQIRTGPFGSQLLHGEFVDNGIAVLGLDNVVGNEFRWAERRFITTQKYEQLRRYTVHPGDVLISIMGTTGRCVVVPDGIPTAINTKHICAVTVDRTRLEPAFLRGTFLWHRDTREHLRRQTKGSIMAGLNMGIIKAMPIPLPPIDRQREFAGRALRVSVARATVATALTAADELFASLQSRAFRGEL